MFYLDTGVCGPLHFYTFWILWCTCVTAYNYTMIVVYNTNYWLWYKAIVVPVVMMGPVSKIVAAIL